MKILRALCAAVSVLFVLLFFSGCSGKITADLSDYGEESIKVVGLADEAFIVTPNELARLKLAKMKIQNHKEGTVKAIGPTLETFLAQYGKTPEDFASIRFKAYDGFVRYMWYPFEAEFIMAIAVENGDEPLAEGHSPMRIIVPDNNQEYGIRGVTTVEFTPR